jgi:hypothetical protein
LLDFPDVGDAGSGGEPQGTGNPSGVGGGGNGGDGGGDGGGGSPPECVFEPAFDWSFQLGTVSISIEENLAHAIAPDGNIWLAGQLLSGQIEIGGTPVSSSGDDDADIYLVELNPAGEIQRGFAFGGVGWAYVHQMAFSSTGTLALVGSYAGAMTFGIDGPSITAAAQGNLADEPYAAELDAWVAVFDPESETFLDAKGYGDGDGIYQEATSVVFDSAGDMIVAAAADGPLDWGMGAPASFDGLALAKLDGQLNEVWSRPLNTGVDLPGYLVMLPDDSFVVAGSTYANDVFGQFVSEELYYGNSDAFVARYSSTGGWIWHRIFGDENEQGSTSVTIGPSGDVYLAGTYRQGLKEKGVVVFSGAETEYFTEDIFFARLAADTGATAWVNRIYGIGYQEPQDIVVGCEERVIITGDIDDQGSKGVDFGDGTPLPSEGDDEYSDLFFASYDGNSGDLLSKTRIGDQYIEFARGIMLHPGGMVLVGSFFDTILFSQEPGGLLEKDTDSEVFVVRYSTAP